VSPTPRQELVLRKVVEGHVATGLPVGSKALAADPELGYGPSTIRNELAVLEEVGLLAHPHTSAGRVPTDAGLPLLRRPDPPSPRSAAPLELSLVRREVDEAMRATSEALSQVTNLLPSSPPRRCTPRRSATSRCSCSSRRCSCSS
jgi:heat-inducible transcriptional repressor